MGDVLWIIDHYSSEPKYGGYTRQYNLAKGIAEYGISVVVIASSFSHFKHTYISEQDIFISKISDTVHYVYIRTEKYNNNAGFKRLTGMVSFTRMISKYSSSIAETLGTPRWVVASSPHIFAWKAGEKLAKKYRADFNIEIRDFWPLELRTQNDPFPYKILYTYFDFLETHSFKRAKHIIGTMPYGNKYFEDFKKPGEEKFVFIGQPLDCDNYDCLAESNWENLPEDIRTFVGDSFFCVFSGYYMKYEGIFKMLDAASELKNVKMLFVGSGNEEEAMREYVSSKKLDNVYISGRINKEFIPALLKRSSVCLAYLHDDNNPAMFKYGLSKNKLNEYMYSGAMTILGFDYDNNEIIDSDSGYTFKPKENRFAELIQKISIMSDEERRSKGENGRKYIMKEHNVQSLSEKYIATVLYEKDKES